MIYLSNQRIFVCKFFILKLAIFQILFTYTTAYQQASRNKQDYKKILLHCHFLFLSDYLLQIYVLDGQVSPKLKPINVN